MIYAVIALLGLIFGSFMNVLIYRIPRGESIVSPASHCPKCNKKLSWYSNIPIVSFILQRGRCRNCGESISIRYPIVELLTSLVFVLIFLQSGGTVESIKYCVMAFLLMAAAFTDLFTSQDAENFPEGGVIPDIYSVGGVLIAYIWAFYDGNLYDSLAGSGTGVFILLIPAVLYQLIRKREGLGLGDIFLMGMVGSFLGSYAVVWVLCAASIIGLVIGFGVLLKTKERNYRLPFAPMIAAGSLLYIFMEL